MEKLTKKTLLAVFIVFLISISLVSFYSPSEANSEDLNVIVIGIDFMRADHMPCYGYDRNTTPNICEFAENNVMYKNAFSQAGWTHPTVGTLFTSQYPQVHGLESSTERLDNSSITLAEYLNNKGYNTVAFPGLSSEAINSSATKYEYQLLPRYGIYRGFDNYTAKSPHLSENVPSAIEWIRDERNKKFFMYVQGFDPIQYKMPHNYIQKHNHTFDSKYNGILHNETIMNQTGALMENIYELNGTTVLELENKTVKLSKEDIKHVISHYDSRLRKSDKKVGKLLEVVKNEGLMDKTVVVVQSSHGVYLNDKIEHRIEIAGKGQRVFGHAGASQAELHTPMIIHAPNQEDQKIFDKIATIDLMPTILNIANVGTRDRLDKMMQGQILPPFSVNYDKEIIFSIGGWAIDSIQSNKWKLIIRGGRVESLINLKSDKVIENRSSSIVNPLTREFKTWKSENRKLNLKLDN